MIGVLVGFVIGAVAGYAFRGLIHRKLQAAEVAGKSAAGQVAAKL